MRIVSIGEILWDVFGAVDHLGGAAFNFAAHARKLGHDVVFVSAVGDDARGRRALERMAALGLTTNYVQIVNPAPETDRYPRSHDPHAVEKLWSVYISKIGRTASERRPAVNRHLCSLTHLDAV